MYINSNYYSRPDLDPTDIDRLFDCKICKNQMEKIRLPTVDAAEDDATIVPVETSPLKC
jgi:hypothetical protein